MAAQRAIDLHREHADENPVDATGAETRAANRRAIVVGLALLALVIAVLGAGFVLVPRLRPRVGTEATEAPAAAAPSAAPAQSAASGGLVVLSQPSDIARLRTPLEREIAQAYLSYWEVYAAAMETLDTARLPEVTAEGRLQEATDEVGDLKGDGIAARIQVKHNFTVISATDQDAAIRDDYVDSSYALNPQTKQPIGTPGESNRVVNIYYLRPVGGTWKVVGGRREAG